MLVFDARAKASHETPRLVILNHPQLGQSEGVNVGTVVLLPPAELPATPFKPWKDQRSIAGGLVGYGVNTYVVPPPEPADPELDLKTATAHWVAHIALNLTQAQPVKPILLVAHGAAGQLLPAIGFAQKASRRPVAGYVVVDGQLPKVGAADWPDAPVTFIRTAVTSDGDGAQPSIDGTLPIAGDTVPQDPARVAELRGWTVYIDVDPVEVLRELFQN